MTPNSSQLVAPSTHAPIQRRTVSDNPLALHSVPVPPEHADSAKTTGAPPAPRSPRAGAAPVPTVAARLEALNAPIIRAVYAAEHYKLFGEMPEGLS